MADITPSWLHDVLLLLTKLKAYMEGIILYQYLWNYFTLQNRHHVYQNRDRGYYSHYQELHHRELVRKDPVWVRLPLLQVQHPVHD